MNKIRLLILANFLDTVPVRKFNLDSWRNGWRDGWYNGYTGVTDQDLTDVSCGTTGCAIGHACTIPEFIQDGLVWEGCPLYGDYEAWEAVHKFFEISPSMAKTLFSDAFYSQGSQGPKDVAERIRYYAQKESISIWILRKHYKATRGRANEWEETFTVVDAYPTREMAVIEAKRKTSDFSNYHFTVQKLTVKPIT